MTESATPALRSSTWAESQAAIPVFTLAAIGGVAGIFWLPIWFLSAELLRLWAPRGGMKWMKARGIPEYTDDRYAQIIGLGPMILIAVRAALSLDWIGPFRALTGDKGAGFSDSEKGILLAVVLGIAMGTAFAGVLRSSGWPRVLAIVGFAANVALIVAAQMGFFGAPNPFAAIVLLPPAFVSSTIAIRWDRWLYQRAARLMASEPNHDIGRWEKR